ncbi:hypothetical protein ACR777_05365 [Sphingobacterium spiritivorum]|uniref:hypothetical protein n=1 Tax=Sphingobacterium spiritivorum TaxID=258 RepID=UPI003DA45037
MRNVIVESGQHLVDVAVQEFGTADGLKIICELNNLEYDDDLQPGQSLILPDLDPDNRIQAYFKTKNIGLNSHIEDSTLQVLSTNDDQLIVNNDNEGIGV